MNPDGGPKPYKGPESYQAEDAFLFFGRDAEADQLIARIVSNRFTLLHAQSGAGKTSLLNAKVIPGLQSRSLLPIRVLPQNDPVELPAYSITHGSAVPVTSFKYSQQLQPKTAELVQINARDEGPGRGPLPIQLLSSDGKVLATDDGPAPVINQQLAPGTYTIAASKNHTAKSPYPNPDRMLSLFTKRLARSLRRVPPVEFTLEVTQSPGK